MTEQFNFIDTKSLIEEGNIVLTGQQILIDPEEKCIIGNHCINNDRKADIMLPCKHYYCLKDFIEWFKITDRHEYGKPLPRCCLCNYDFHDVLNSGAVFIIRDGSSIQKECDEIKRRNEQKNMQIEESKIKEEHEIMAKLSIYGSSSNE